MAATSNYCRVKLFIKGKSSSETRALWHTVNFCECIDVSSVVVNLKKMLNLGECSVDLYMQNVLIPQWENCARVFRDNDDVELRYTPSTVHDHGASMRSDQDEPGNKKRKRTSKSKSVKRLQKTELIDDVMKTEEPSLSLPERTAGQSLANPPSVVESKKKSTDDTQLELREEITSDRDLSESSDEDEPSVRRKAERSAQLTPIEQQLIAELQSLPKAKRKRKHKRRKCQKAIAPVITTAEVDNSPPKVHSLNSSYSGVKKVFDSADEKEDQCESTTSKPSTDLVGDSQAQLASKSWETINQFNDGHSKSAPVPQLPVQVNGNVAMGTESPNISSVQVTPKPQPSLPVSAKVDTSCSPKAAKAASSRQTAQSSNTPGQPVVYRREKLKLRATISPAVLEQLAACTDQSSTTAETTASPTHCNTSKKGIRWHLPKVSSSTPKQPLARETAVTDEQTNVSFIHQCDSSPSKGPNVQAPTPSKDFSLYPNLTGAPRVGDLVAFKRLEMSSNYTPEPSKYKEGTVLNYEPQSTLLQVRLTNKPTEKSERRGVFDIHIEEDDGTLTNVSVEGPEIVDVLSNFLELKLMNEGQK